VFLINKAIIVKQVKTV